MKDLYDMLMYDYLQNFLQMAYLTDVFFLAFFEKECLSDEKKSVSFFYA